MITFNVQLSEVQSLKGDDNTQSANIYVPLNYRDYQLSEKIDRYWHLERYGFQLSEAEILNYFTHRRAWELFLLSDEQVGCFIELNNDVIINYKEVEESINSAEENWDIFFPYNKLENVSVNEIRIRSLNLLNPNLRELSRNEPYFLGMCWGASLYFLSRNGANKLLKIDDIRQRVEDEMFYQNKRNNIEIYFDSFDWIKVKNLQPFVPKERLQIIKYTVLNYNTWDLESKNIAKAIMCIMGQIGRDFDIDLILQGGSHLGYIRHGGIMPWDDDIDIGIEERHIEKFIELLSSYSNLRIKKFIESTTNAIYYKIWDINGKPIDYYEWTFPFIDLWLYDRSDRDYVFKNGIICPDSNLHEALDIIFEGASLKIPHNSLQCLDSRYVDWRTTIRIYPYSHKLEKRRPYELRTTIEVNASGRIIEEEQIKMLISEEK